MATVDFCAFDSGYVLDSSFSMTEKWLRHDVTRGIRQANSTADKISQVGQKTRLYSHSSKKEDKTFWQKYKKVIWITTGVVLLGAAVAAVVILTAGAATPVAGSALGSGIAALAEGIENSSQNNFSGSSPTPTSLNLSEVNKIEVCNLTPPDLLCNSITSAFIPQQNNFLEPPINLYPVPENFFVHSFSPSSTSTALLSSDQLSTLDELNNTNSIKGVPQLFDQKVIFSNEQKFISSSIPEQKFLTILNAPHQSMPITESIAKEEKRYLSHAFTIPGTQKDSTYIGWINGICNSFEDSRNTGAYLQSLADGHTISGIYNQTHTALLDIPEAAINHFGYSPITAKLLQNEWRTFHERNSEKPNLKLLHVCHSQGAIHTKNALEGLPLEVQNRVIVLNIAPAVIVPDGICFRSYNYASEKDIVYKLEPIPVAFEPGIIDDCMVPRFGETSSKREELIILPAHPHATDIDHGILSPTYKPVIEAVFAEYKKHNGEYLPEDKGKRK